MIIRAGLKSVIAGAALLMSSAALPAAAATVGVSGTGDLSSNRTSAELTITALCDVAVNVGETKTGTLTVHLFQSVGRLINIGIATEPITCDGNQADMILQVNAIQGLKFQPGPATVILKLSEQTTDSTAAVTNSTTTESGGKVTLRP
jgi:hypothetical protein